LIVAGETSGDLHGAELIRSLKNLNPELRILAVGGDRMHEAGAEILYHVKDLSFLGFKEVIAHLPFIQKVQWDLLKTIERMKIRVVVLIDYPGFNLNFAKKVKRRGGKVVYYISPQVWAWGSGRVKKIAKRVDKMLVVFPFEKEFYEKHGIPVEYVGNPIMDKINEYDFEEREKFFEKYGLEKDKEILLVFPGSREHEVKTILPTALKAAEKLAEEFRLQTVISLADNIEKSYVEKYSRGNAKIIAGENYNLMNLAKFGIIKSGTSSLEASIVGLPFVVVYRTSAVTYAIGKALVKIDSIAMPNIVLGKKVLPELVQNDMTAERIYETVKTFLSDISRYEKLKSSLKEVKEKLSRGGNSSQRSASIILAVLNEA